MLQLNSATQLVSWVVTQKTLFKIVAGFAEREQTQTSEVRYIKKEINKKKQF